MQTPRGIGPGEVLVAMQAICGFLLAVIIVVGAIVSIGVAIAGIPKREPVPSPHVGKVVKSAGDEMGDVVIQFTDGTRMRVHTFGRKLVID